MKVIVEDFDYKELHLDRLIVDMPNITSLDEYHWCRIYDILKQDAEDMREREGFSGL